MTGSGCYIEAKSKPLAYIQFLGYTNIRPGEWEKNASLDYEWNRAPCPTAPHGVQTVKPPHSHSPPDLYLILAASLTI